MRPPAARLLLLAAPLLVLVLVTAAPAESFSAGAPASAARGGCVCHASAASDSVVVTIDGAPPAWEPGASYSLTLRIAGGPVPVPVSGHAGGFALEADAGILDSVDDSTQRLSNGLLTHTQSGSALRSWTFTWTAPSRGAEDVTLAGAGQAVNGDGLATNLDQWNFVVATIAAAAAAGGEDGDTGGGRNGSGEGEDAATPGAIVALVLAVLVTTAIAARRFRT